MSGNNFFSELKKRNVYKIAIAYAIIVWLILQVGSIVLPTIKAPEWVMQVFIFLLIIGFPIALVLAWAQGLKKKEKGQQNIEKAQSDKEDIQPASSILDPLTIAVLPFEDMSPNKDQEYFSDGMAEEILNLLAGIPGLQVIGRTSSFSFKNQNIGIKEIGKKLKVAHILEGSVRKSGNKIRITAQLTKAKDGFHLWSQSYDRELDDVFAIQDEIAAHIVEKLKLTLKASEQDVVRPQSQNVKAYDLYLKGKYQFHNHTKQDNLLAIELLQKAVSEDRNFALGHGALAQAFAEHYFTYDTDPKWENLAILSIENAIALDPNIPEIYVAKGNLLWTRKNGFPHIDAINMYNRALEINADHAEAHNELARVYWHIGLMKQAVQFFDKALATDPELKDSIFRKGWFELHRGQFKTALELFEEVPENFLSEIIMGLKAKCLWYLGESEKAYAIIKDAKKLFSNAPEITSTMAIFFALQNEYSRSEDEIRLAIHNGSDLGHFHHITHNIAQAYAIMQNNEQAVKWLRFTKKDGFPCYPWFNEDPFFDPIRRDPGFIRLMADMEQQWLQYKNILNE